MERMNKRAKSKGCGNYLKKEHRSYSKNTYARFQKDK